MGHGKNEGQVMLAIASHVHEFCQFLTDGMHFKLLARHKKNSNSLTAEAFNFDQIS